MTFPKAIYAEPACGQDPAAAGKPEPRRPIMLRAPPEMLARIDKAAKRLGLTRSAFVLSAVAERLEKMNG